MRKKKGRNEEGEERKKRKGRRKEGGRGWRKREKAWRVKSGRKGRSVMKKGGGER